MCGRFTQERPASDLAEIFAAEPLADDLGARFNVAPTDDAYVVVQREDRRAVTAYRWGLVPHWSNDLRAGSRMFNARAETIDRQPAFRYAFSKRRCLVPVDAYYEWQRAGNPVFLRDGPLENQRLQLGAGRVNSRRPACRSTSNDDNSFNSQGDILPL